MVEMQMGSLGGWNCISKAYLFLYIFCKQECFSCAKCVMVNGNLDLLPNLEMWSSVSVCLLMNLRASCSDILPLCVCIELRQHDTLENLYVKSVRLHIIVASSTSTPRQQHGQVQSVDYTHQGPLFESTAQCLLSLVYRYTYDTQVADLVR